MNSYQRIIFANNYLTILLDLLNPSTVPEPLMGTRIPATRVLIYSNM